VPGPEKLDERDHEPRIGHREEGATEVRPHVVAIPGPHRHPHVDGPEVGRHVRHPDSREQKRPPEVRHDLQQPRLPAHLHAVVSGDARASDASARGRARGYCSAGSDPPDQFATQRVESMPMDESRDASTVGSNESSEFEREWTEILNEIRVALPGVQILFGFLLAVPFTDGFHRMGDLLRHAFFFSFLCTTASSAFLIAPSVYHRLHWRRDVVDKELMLLTCNRLAILGVVFLALAMTSAVYIVSVPVAGRDAALAVTALAGVLL